MSNQLSLEKRTVQGKQLKSLRRAGQIPSVIYGSGDPILTSSEYIATDKVLREAGYHSRSSSVSPANLSLPLRKP